MSLPHGEPSEEPMARREPSVRITYDDYVHFPDDKRYEVIDGEAFVMPSPNRRHQQILGRLHLRIASHLDGRGGGEIYVAPFDVVLTPTDILQPDLVYVAEADRDILTEANIRGAPTWAIEILSPTTRSRDLTLKRQAYERTGLPELWFVDPEDESVRVLVLDEGRYTEATVARPPGHVSPACLPELELDLAEIFGRSLSP